MIHNWTVEGDESISQGNRSHSSLAIFFFNSFIEV